MRGGGNEQSLEGLVLSIAERQKLHKNPCPGKTLMFKRTHAHVCTQTQTYTYININKYWQLNTKRKKAFAPDK